MKCQAISRNPRSLTKVEQRLTKVRGRFRSPLQYPAEHRQRFSPRLSGARSAPGLATSAVSYALGRLLLTTANNSKGVVVLTESAPGQ
jgi:hypothetical protein